MSKTITLHPVPELIRAKRKLDVVFVHGLGDNDASAWQQKNDARTFWPQWLADDFAEAQIWMLRYSAPQFWFNSHAMPLPDRAMSMLSYLVDNQIGQRDLLFITHSLGGLIVKHLLQSSQMGLDARFGLIAAATRGIVFLATPHTGSNIATVASFLGIASRTTADLHTDDPWLMQLNDWYRNNARQRSWQTRAFYEKEKTMGTLVVSHSSANPCVEGVAAIPIDADHLGICKPDSKEAPVYKAVAALTQDLLEKARFNSLERGDSVDQLSKIDDRNVVCDLYIIHNAADKEWTSDLVDALSAQGMRCFFDEQFIGLGKKNVAAAYEALESSKHILLILSAHSVQSRLVELEWITALYADPNVSARRLIPIVRSDCEVPSALRHIQPLDARVLNVTLTAQEIVRLIHSIDGQQQRINDGLYQQRHKLEVQAQRRALGSGQKAVGERPSRVVEYFKGRKEQCLELECALLDPAIRLVSIIGRGGLGKTALASKVLAQLESGIWAQTDKGIPIAGVAYLSTQTAGITLERIFLDCSRLLGGNHESNLLRTWKNAGLRAGEKINDLLDELTSEGIHLILLDNMEILLDDMGYVTNSDLHTFIHVALAHSGSTRVIVTSRIPLQVEAQLMRFSRIVDLEIGLPTSEAIELIRELDPNNDCLLRDASEKELGNAISRVHGSPRALELLVGLLKNDPFMKLSDLLSSSRGKQYELGFLVESSYKALPEESQHAMQAIAVYGRPVPSFAVEFLLAPFHPGHDMSETLKRLCRIHSINVDRETRRAYLHPIDSELAYSAIPEEGHYSRRSLERKAAEYYRQLRTRCEEWHVLDDLDPHLSEFEHLVKAADYGVAALVLSEIDVYLAWHGYAERVLTMWQGLEGKIDDPKLQLLRIVGLGRAYHVLGPLTQALAYHEKTLILARSLGEEEIAREAGRDVGDALRRMGLYEQSMPYLTKIVDDYRQLGRSQDEAKALATLSLLRSALRDVKGAVDDAKRALIIAERCQDFRLEAVSHNALAAAYLTERNSQAALLHARRISTVYEKINYIDGLAYIQNVIGIAELQESRIEAATTSFELASRLGHDAGQPRIEAIALLNSAFLHWKHDKRIDALEAAKRASTLTSHLGSVEHKAASVMVNLLEGIEKIFPSDNAALYAEYFYAARRSPDLYYDEC